MFFLSYSLVDRETAADLFVMFLSHLLTTVGETSCSKVLMPVIFRGKAMSMLMSPVYGSWKYGQLLLCTSFMDQYIHVNTSNRCEATHLKDVALQFVVSSSQIVPLVGHHGHTYICLFVDSKVAIVSHLFGEFLLPCTCLHTQRVM